MRASYLTAVPAQVATFLVVLGFAAVLSGEETDWKACSDPETRFVLRYPGSLIHSTAPAATGCAFQTADGQFNVEAIAQPEAAEQGETLDSRMQKEIDLLGDTVTYKTKGDSWFVLSGVTPDGTEYYRKLYTKGSRWVALRITYPHSNNKRFDPWVTRIEKSFVPFASTEGAGPKVSPESNE